MGANLRGVVHLVGRFTLRLAFARSRQNLCVPPNLDRVNILQRRL